MEDATNVASIGKLIDFNEMYKILPEKGFITLQVAKDGDKMVLHYKPTYKLDGKPDSEVSKQFQPVTLKGTPSEFMSHFSDGLAQHCARR
jgi:hypothetical protein